TAPAPPRGPAEGDASLVGREQGGMDVVLAAHGPGISQPRRDVVQRSQDVALDLALGSPGADFAQGLGGDNGAGPGAEILGGDVGAGDLAEILVDVAGIDCLAFAF